MHEPFSRVWLSQVIEAAYGHLARWVDGAGSPPHAPYLEFTGTAKARNELGLALGGIQLSQVAVPTALNTGSNSGRRSASFWDARALRRRAARVALPQPRSYVSAVDAVDAANVAAGYLLPADAELNQREAAQSDVGKKANR